MAKIRVKLAPGRRILDPATMGRGPKHARPLHPDGILVEDTEPFWYRRLQDGDVIRMTLRTGADMNPAVTAPPDDGTMGSPDEHAERATDDEIKAVDDRKADEAKAVEKRQADEAKAAAREPATPAREAGDK